MLGFGIETDFDSAALTEHCSVVFGGAVGMLGDAVMADCEIYVPYDTGALCRSVRRGGVTEGDGTIGCDVIWSAPHAAAVYYGDARGIRYHTEHHAHARARWFEGARASTGVRWKETVCGYVREQF